MTDYWGAYSKEQGLYEYINVGIYTEGKKAEQMLTLMEALEDNDDVNNVYANFDIPDEVMEAIG